MSRLLVVTTIPRTFDDFLLPYVHHFRAKGWRVDALSGAGYEGTQAARAYERTFAVRWSRNPLDPRNLATAPKAIRGIVEREGYEIVHVHTPVAAFVTRYALRSLPRRVRPAVVYTAHGFHFHPSGSPLRNAMFVGLERLAGRWTDFLVVMNREDAEAARRLGLVPSERLREMPGIGLDLRFYSRESVTVADRERVRAELGLGKREAYLLMVAEFLPRKRHVDLLRAFAAIAQEPVGAGVRLVLAGHGPLYDEVQALARALGIAERVTFLGHRRDLPPFIAEARAVVLPSVQEGLPRCILEAMAIGTPVVATRIRGSMQLLQGGAGRLVAPTAVPELAAALREVLASPERAREMAVEASRRVGSYGIEHLLELHEALYAEALEDREARAGGR